MPIVLLVPFSWLTELFLLKSTGLVELSMTFDTKCLQFFALTAEKLCVDLILGMDFYDCLSRHY